MCPDSSASLDACSAHWSNFNLNFNSTTDLLCIAFYVFYGGGYLLDCSLLFIASTPNLWVVFV
jgi:hypothetical protein